MDSREQSQTSAGDDERVPMFQPGPLDGLLILEFATMVTGPFAGQILGDMGATVIKIEDIAPDIMRGVPPSHKDLSGGFAQWNRNKKSLSVDFRSAEGITLIHDLVRQADGFLQNARPGIAEKLKLGYSDLSALNRNLVYVSITGFGYDGPYRDLPTYDLTMQGMTGFMFEQGNGRGPEVIRCTIADKAVGMSAAMAMMAALLGRERGRAAGQFVDVNMLNAYSAFILPDMIYDRSLAATGPLPPLTTIFNVAKVKDGYMTGLFMQPLQFRRFCEAFGRPDLIDDPRFASPVLLARNQPQLFDEFAPIFAELTKAECMSRALKINLPLAPVNTLDDYFANEQVRNNQSYVEFDDPEYGQLLQVNSFARFEKTPHAIGTRPPKLGEQSAEVLRLIGLEDAQIARLIDSQVVRTV